MIEWSHEKFVTLFELSWLNGIGGYGHWADVSPCFSCWDRCGARSNRSGTFPSFPVCFSFHQLDHARRQEQLGGRQVVPQPRTLPAPRPKFLWWQGFVQIPDGSTSQQLLIIHDYRGLLHSIYIYWILSWIFVVQILFQMFRLGIGILTHTHIPLYCGAEVTRPTFLPVSSR